MAGELVGRFLAERQALKCQALSTDTSILTALANDYSFEIVFARQLEANARAGDVAIGITTSGNSANVVAALEKARALGMKTLALTGPDGGKCAPLADVLLAAGCDGMPTPRVQEAQGVIYHIICEFVEQQMIGS